MASLNSSTYVDYLTRTFLKEYNWSNDRYDEAKAMVLEKLAKERRANAVRRNL